MKDLDRMYKTFRLEDGLQEQLLSLSDYNFPMKQTHARVVVETLVVEKEGDRRIVSKEEQDAQLVATR